MVGIIVFWGLNLDDPYFGKLPSGPRTTLVMRTASFHLPTHSKTPASRHMGSFQNWDPILVPLNI